MNPLHRIDPWGLKYPAEPSGPVTTPYIPNPASTAFCSYGFCVAATDIEGYLGKIAGCAGISHVDITYDGTVVSVGSGGNEARNEKTYSEEELNLTWRLSKMQDGQFDWGPEGVKEQSCSVDGQSYPSDEDIRACLKDKHYNPDKNCQGDTAEKIEGCCLTGFSTFVSDWLYWVLPGDNTCSAMP